MKSLDMAQPEICDGWRVGFISIAGFILRRVSLAAVLETDQQLNDGI
jgi:hypothetical protein